MSFTADWFSHHIPTWNKYLSHLKGKANIKVLELGSYEGKSSLWLLSNILTHPSSHIWCCDLFPAWLEPRFKKNITKHASKVTFLKGKTAEHLKSEKLKNLSF